MLRRNIYGVDLDPQAVEIGRLNLLARMVRQQELLPELKDNIRVGNSLISGSPAELRRYFGGHRRAKRSFAWGREFEDIMAQGGFDIIIGNPPYVRIQSLDRDEVAYYNDHYQAATGNYDIYCLFVERALHLLKPGGRLGFIIPNKFMQAQYGTGLRKLLADSKAVSKLVDFGDAQVFESGTNYTCLLFLSKTQNTALVYARARDVLSQAFRAPSIMQLEKTAFHVPASQIGAQQWVFVSGIQGQLKNRLDSATTRLADISVSIFQGLKTGADRVYVLDLVGRDDRQITVYSRARRQQRKLEPDALRPLIKGQEMRRFCIRDPQRLVLFPYEAAKLIPAEDLQNRSPSTWAYLEENRDALESREKGRWRGPSWYGYSRIQNLDKFDLPKIITPDVAAAARYSLDRDGRFYFSGGGAGGYGIILKPGHSPELVVGLLNSKLVDWYLHQISSRFRGGYYSYESRFIAQLPIHIPNVNTPEGRSARDTLVALVERMLQLHERLAAKGEVHDEERAQMKRDIEHTDREIDELVYDLYGLTADERELIEREVSR